MLLLDEPTEGIQPSVILEIEAAIERLHKATGVAVLLVEQYLDLALRLAVAHEAAVSARAERER